MSDKDLKDYIVLLRGINVGGSKPLKMQELRKILVQMDYLAVRTYIQSGNIVLKSRDNVEQISKDICDKLKCLKDYDVPVLTVSRSDWQKMIDENPFHKEEEIKRLSITICDKLIDQEELAEKINFDLKSNYYKVQENCIYQVTPDGYRNTKLTNNWIESKLKVRATTRNWKTVVKLLDMSSIDQDQA